MNVRACAPVRPDEVRVLPPAMAEEPQVVVERSALPLRRAVARILLGRRRQLKPQTTNTSTQSVSNTGVCAQLLWLVCVCECVCVFEQPEPVLANIHHDPWLRKEKGKRKRKGKEQGKARKGKRKGERKASVFLWLCLFPAPGRRR